MMNLEGLEKEKAFARLLGQRLPCDLFTLLPADL